MRTMIAGLVMTACVTVPARAQQQDFSQVQITIFARPNLRARMVKPAAQASGQPGVPAPAMALPTVTYDAPVTFHVNGDEVRLIPVPAAHTDGDTMVYFANANVIISGAENGPLTRLLVSSCHGARSRGVVVRRASKRA